LLDQTPGDLFHSLVTQAGLIGLAVHLILFAHQVDIFLEVLSYLAQALAEQKIS
jgi:hypothetical protein